MSGGRFMRGLLPLRAKPGFQVVDVVINLVADDGRSWPDAEPAPALERPLGFVELPRQGVFGHIIVKNFCV